MIASYDLARLDANTFEHLVNTLALEVLGNGATGFGPGPDGGRDGYFDGAAPYPSTKEGWSGRWYIQSKFMTPNLGANPQQWLFERVKSEIVEFTKPQTKRVWPDNWIIATNVDPSPSPNSGAFDKIYELVKSANPDLAGRTHIWGGKKILDFLALYPRIAEYYGEFLTSGQVLSRIYERFADASANIDGILRNLVVTQLVDQQYTKLEQAGSGVDNRPRIQKLFADLPFVARRSECEGMAAREFFRAAARNHRVGLLSDRQSPTDDWQWRLWNLQPHRSRIWFVKGGPGQGKSTLSQFISQVNRAALILADDNFNVTGQQYTMAQEIRSRAVEDDFWPASPRIPVNIELREFAQWYGQVPGDASRRFLSFLSHKLSKGLGQAVYSGTLQRAFARSRWLFIFDGLDEVPSDVKDALADEIAYFVDDELVGCKCDSMIVCTSRPQGYSGQFDAMELATLELRPLTPQQALACAYPVLSFDRPDDEASQYKSLLVEALKSSTIQEIMTSPLQAHIMAVVVRDGGRPPERKWLLFENFYLTIKKREANHKLADRKIATLIREESQLIKALHNKLGFELHARAETSRHAITSLGRGEFERLVRAVVAELKDHDIDETVALLMQAATDRLVLVNTPEASSEVRFDIRPLQEFFAAEFIYNSTAVGVLTARLSEISGDAHWREVMHFTLSGLVENSRSGELSAAASVLCELNNSGKDESTRVLSRRLARGSLLVARLLQEGVLDQDKRVRALFREALLPLLGCVSAPEYLFERMPSQSAAWFLETMIDTLSELHESETLGAALLLSDNLPDGHPRIGEVINFLRSVSDDYLAAFLSRIPYAFVRGGLMHEWFAKFILELFVSERGLEMAHREIRLGDVLAHSKGGVRDAALAMGYSAQIADIFAAIVPAGATRRDVVRDKQASFDTSEFGILDTSYTEPPSIWWENWTEDTWKSLSASHGVLRATYLAVKFFNGGQVEAANELAALVSHMRTYQYLPQSVLDLFEVTPAFDIGHLQGGSLRARAVKPGWRRSVEVITRPFGPVDWHGLVANRPAIALLFLMKSQTPNAIAYVSNPENAAHWIGSIQKEVRTLYYFVGNWAQWFAIPHFGPQLRALLCQALFKPNDEDLSREFETFELNLPSDSALLPHVLNAVARAFISYRQPSGNPDSGLSLSRRLGESIARYVPDYSDLRIVADNPIQPVRVKAAATIMAIGHPQAKLDKVNEDIARLADFDATVEEPWFIRALVGVLFDRVSNEEPYAMRVVTQLIEATRANYAARICLEEYYRRWREASQSPVTKRGNHALWH